jgi:hypothetical protein
MPIVERFGPALGARGWVGMRHELAKNEALAETYLEENYFSDGDLKLNSKNILEDYAAGIWDPYGKPIDRTPDYFLWARSSAVNRTDAVVRTTAVTGGRAIRGSVAGQSTVAGSAEVEMTEQDHFLFYAVLGQAKRQTIKPRTETEPGIYRWLFKGEEENRLPWFNYWQHVDRFCLFTDLCRLNTLTLTCAAGEQLTASLDVMGRRQEVIGREDVSWDTPEGSFFHWQQAGIEAIIAGVGENLVRCNSFEVSITNNLVGDKFYLGSGRLVADIPVLARGVTFSTEYEFTDDRLYTAMFEKRPGTLEHLKISFIIEEGVKELHLYFPKVTVDTAPPELAGPDILTCSISAVAESATWTRPYSPFTGETFDIGIEVINQVHRLGGHGAS